MNCEPKNGIFLDETIEHQTLILPPEVVKYLILEIQQITNLFATWKHTRVIGIIRYRNNHETEEYRDT